MKLMYLVEAETSTWKGKYFKTFFTDGIIKLARFPLPDEEEY